jgi:diguanylate cyclase (GGDEF)-like protein
LLSFDKIQSQERMAITEEYRAILTTLSSSPWDEKRAKDRFFVLIEHSILLEIPYVVLINELHAFENIVLEAIIENGRHDKLKTVISFFATINRHVAKVYLKSYIKTLTSINQVRINSMADIIHESIIAHYKAHLVWLNQLAICVKEQNSSSFPQQDPAMCAFGKWLNSEGKAIIQNNSKFKALASVHECLHMFSSKIYKQLGSKDYHIFITYLEKCELLSLTIGTELALIENIITNDQATKDLLTGALNRNVLPQVFASQYEIALATNNSFILAMCDMDHFKAINDTFGHVAGDKILQSFVDIAKECLRNSDMVLRYGGEEFIIILPAVKKERALEILDAIRNAFSQHVLTYENQAVNTTVSMGALEITPETYYKKVFLDEYVSIVDKRLYRAKDEGRNRVCIN